MDIQIGTEEMTSQMKEKDKSIKTNKDQTQQLKKKLQNAISALTKAEKKPFDQLIGQDLSNNIFAFHFGTGDEDDYNTLKRYLQPFGQFKLQLFPVKNYAFIEFSEPHQAQQLMSSLINCPEIPVSYINLQYQNKERPTFFFYSKVASNQISQSLANDIPNAKFEVKIPGLTLIKDFMTQEEEKKILEEIDKYPWNKMNQRRVQHYGYEFIYGQNTVDTSKPAEKPIPDFLQHISARVSNLFQNQGPVDQLTINEYEPGMGIPPHFDVHEPFEEQFVSISLLSGLVMSFKSYKSEEQHLYLPPRSCALFTGEVRYAWFHSIASRKMDRVEGEMSFRRRRLSLTFRTIRKNLKCQCQYPFFCQAQGYDPSTMKNKNPLLEKYLAQQKDSNKNSQNKENKGKEVPQKTEDEIQMMKQVENLQATEATDIEKKYVYEIYDKIAPHFSHTRYKPWPKIEGFLNSLDEGSLVADVGCGNGKYLHVNKDKIQMIGTDRSQNLIEICRQKDKDFQVFSADCLKLPLKSNTFDAVISIAVIHHFSNKSLRKSAIQELLRITRSKGKILIYVWAFEQDEKNFPEQDVFVPWNLAFRFEDGKVLQQAQQKEEQKELQEEKKDQNEKQSYLSNSYLQDVGIEDFQINDEKKTVVYKRYYHVFKKGELEELLGEMSGFQIIDQYYDHANWVVVIQKD